MEKWISTFSKGINQDMNVNKIDNMSMFDCQNFRITSKDSLSTGALTPVEGSTPKLAFGANDVIQGACIIRDTVIIFSDSPEGAKIYKWKNDGTDYMSSPTLVYQSPDLHFTKKIRAVGHYETPAIQKIYFTDGDTFFKHMNIETNNIGKSSDVFDIVSNITFSEMILTMRVGGNMKAGKTQYAYQLYSVNGSESCFSPTSQFAHLTEASEAISSLEYQGSEVGKTVNKSVEVTITDIDPLFTRLRLVALDYTVFNHTPSIRLVGEYTVEGVDRITILDTGESNGEYSLEEFRFIQNDVYPQSLDIKDNRLFIANLKNNYFEITDEEFDARTFRFHQDGYCYVNYLDSSLQSRIDISIVDGQTNITNKPPIEHEQFNTFNDTTNDFAANSGVGDGGIHQFKYNPRTYELGGLGSFISYKFITDKVLLDEGGRTESWTADGIPVITSEVLPPYENHANPLSKVGYMRDEIYRFGIVFFDKKGRQSFVKWIGDIRMPSNKEMPYVQVENGKTYANILGLQFTVNIPDSVRSKISGYQIVRAERNYTDRTIISQGISAYAVNGTDTDEQGMLYSLATVPTIADCVNKKIVVESWTEERPTSGGIPVNTATGPGAATLNDKYIEFTSPEIAFNKTLLPKSDSYVEAIGYLNTVTGAAIAGPTARNDYNWNMNLCTKYKNYAFPTGQSKKKIDVVDNKLFMAKERGTSSRDASNDATITVLPGGVLYNNQCCTVPGSNKDDNKMYGLRGVHSLILSEAGYDILTNNDAWTGKGAGNVGFNHDTRVFLSNYRTHKKKSIYGGVSYQARNSTMYYPASKFKSVATRPVAIEGTHTFNIKYGSLPIDVENGQTATVYANSSRPGVGDFLYKDAALTQPWDVEGFVWFTDTSLYGTEVVGVAIVDTPEYDVGEIMLLTGYHVGSGYEPVGEEDEPDDVVEVFNGDTYINFFVYLRSIWDNLRKEGDVGAADVAIAGTRTVQSIVMFPVESSINLDLRLDPIQKYIQWGWLEGSYIPNYKLGETRSFGVSRWGTAYPVDLGDLYRYNSAYSAMDKTKEYIPKPFDFASVTQFDTRIAVSDRKINNEYTDSWLKFKFNEYLDVDSTHGPICRILTFKNNLFYFQTTGVGVASVNAKVLLTDNNPGALSVGTGGILDRFDYITQQSGTELYDAIVASDRNIYYADNRRKRVNKLLGEGEAAVSMIKGIDSMLDKKPFLNVVAGFDKGFNEVFFNIDGKTVVFNEAIDAFMGSYTFSPSIIISIGNDTFSVESYADDTPWLVNDIPQNVDYDSNGNYILMSNYGEGMNLVKLNKGPRGDFSAGGSGSGPQDSFVELIINPNGNIVDSFDTLDIRTESTDDYGNDILTDVFYKLEAWNAYQSLTRDLSFSYNGHESDGTIKRIGRVWRTPIMPTPGPGVVNKPMIDTYIKIRLTYSNASGYNFKVHDITTYYRPKSV